jgi:GNAT superfamily N-acetyltransferase
MPARIDTNISLRQAAPADAALIRRITHAAWTGRVDPSSSAYRETEDEIAQQIAEGGAFIMDIDGEPAGSIRYSPIPNAWEVRRMGVAPPWRGKGYAGLLMDAVVEHARRHGISDLRLAVRYDQPRLIGYYRTLGFQPAPGIVYAHQSPGTPAPTVLRRVLEE